MTHLSLRRRPPAPPGRGMCVFGLCAGVHRSGEQIWRHELTPFLVVRHGRPSGEHLLLRPSLFLQRGNLLTDVRQHVAKLNELRAYRLLELGPAAGAVHSCSGTWSKVTLSPSVATRSKPGDAARVFR